MVFKNLKLFCILPFLLPPFFILPLHSETDPLKKVSLELAEGFHQHPHAGVAVLAIAQQDNRNSDGSSYVSDRLATGLAKDKQLAVLERNHITRILEELHLSETGILDSKTTQRLGSVLGADIIVTGTLIDLSGETAELNARGLLAENGRIISASRALMPRTWGRRQALGQVVDSGRPRKAAFRNSSDSLLILARDLKKQLPKKPALMLGVMTMTYDKGRISTGSDLISERLLTYLVQEGLPLVERRLINSYLGEVHLIDAGIVNPDAIKKIRKMSGVNALVVGTLNDLSDDQTQVMVHVIDVESSVVLAAGETIAARLWMDNPRFPRRDLAGAPIPGFFAPVTATDDDGNRRHRLDDSASPGKKARYYPSGMPFYLQGGQR